MNILVTGGASGLGEAITRRLAAAETSYVYFTYCKSLDKTKELERDFSNVKGIKCDFGNTSDIDSFLHQMNEMNLDVVVNNAITGFTQMHFHKIDQNTFVESFQKNVIPVVRITQQSIKIFRKKKYGKIISILTSSLINKPPIGWSEYVANKAYLLALSKSWAAENARFNITSNCVSPSFMQTHLNRDIDERIIESIIESHPLNRLLTTREVADAVYFLIHSSQQINGVNLIINSSSDVL